MQKMNVKAWCFSAIALVALFLVGCGRSNAASVDLKTLVARSEAHHAMEQAEKEKLAQMALLNGEGNISVVSPEAKAVAKTQLTDEQVKIVEAKANAAQKQVAQTSTRSESENAPRHTAESHSGEESYTHGESSVHDSHSGSSDSQVSHSESTQAAASESSDDSYSWTLNGKKVFEYENSHGGTDIGYEGTDEYSQEDWDKMFGGMTEQ